MKYLLLFLILVSISGCVESKTDFPIVSVSTTEETLTLTQTVPASIPISSETITPLVMWDKKLAENPVDTIPYPDLEVITPQNVSRIEEIDRWGLGAVNGIALSPDAKTIVVSTMTGIFVYDRETLSQIGKIDVSVERNPNSLFPCSARFDNIDFSPDGRYLAIGEQEIIVWDVILNNIHAVYKAPDESLPSLVSELMYNADGSRIFVSRGNEAVVDACSGRFEILDTNEGMLLSQTVFYFAYEHKIHPGDNNEVFLRSDISMTYRFDASSGELISEDYTESHAWPASELSINDQDRSWRISFPEVDKKCEFTINKVESAFPTMTDFARDKAIAITLGDSKSGDLRIWDFGGCHLSDRFLYFPEAKLDPSFSQLGNYLHTKNYDSGAINNDRYIHIWDVTDGRPLFPVKAEQIAFNFDESKLYAIPERYPGKASIINALTGEEIYQLINAESIGPHSWFFPSPSDNDMAIIGRQLADLSGSGRFVKTFGHYENLFSPDGKIIAVLDPDLDLDDPFQQTDHQIHFFNATTAMPVDRVPIELPISSETYLFNSITISPNWRYVAIRTTEKVIILDLETHEIVSEIVTDEQPGVTFSADGELLIIPDNNVVEIDTIDIWNTQTGIPIVQLPVSFITHGGKVVVSPDGKLLVFLAYDSTVRIYGVRRP